MQALLTNRGKSVRCVAFQGAISSSSSKPRVHKPASWSSRSPLLVSPRQLLQDWEDLSTTELPAAGLKLTAANTHVRIPISTKATTDTLLSSSSSRVAVPAHAAPYVLQRAMHNTSNSSSSNSMRRLARGLQAAAAQAAATQQQQQQLLVNTSTAGAGKGSTRPGTPAGGPASNIVPWAPSGTSAATAVQIAAATLVTDPVPTDAKAAAAPADAEAAAHAGVPAATPAPPKIDQHSLVVVYLDSQYLKSSHNDNSSSSMSSMDPVCHDSNVVSLPVPRAVAYLRLPQQQEDYEEAVRQGLCMMVLPGVLDRRGQHGAISAEELAYQAQQDGKWSDEPEPLWFRGRYEDHSCYDSSSSVSSNSSDGDLGAGAGKEQQEEEIQQQEQQQQQQGEKQPAVLVMAAQAAAGAATGAEAGAGADGAQDSRGAAAAVPVAPSSDTTPPPCPTVKVEVGVHMRTQPGQRVVLVGNTPSLGNWDLSRAWKLKWSDGHIWRGCLEFPADLHGVEFKAVLKSAEATVWERGSNRQVQLQGASSDTLALQYAFQK